MTLLPMIAGPRRAPMILTIVMKKDCKLQNKVPSELQRKVPRVMEGRDLILIRGP